MTTTAFDLDAAASHIAPDFLVENHGSIYLLTPQNEPAFAWADLHIDAQGQSIGQRTIAVEHRYIRDIVEGAIADGFTVR